jgi:putative transport protein
LTAIAVARVLGLDPGFAGGLLSGSLTQSAAMGTATDAINSLPLPDATRATYVAHIAVADAVCYIFGCAAVIIFLTVVAPLLLKVDLKAEALKLEQELGMTRDKPGLASAWRKFELRAYRLPEGGALVSSTVAAAEARMREHRLFIHRVRRGDRILEASPEMALAAGDVVALSGPRQVIVDAIGPRADEIEDKELLDVPVTAADVLLMNPKLAGMTIADASRLDGMRGLYLRSITRGGQDIPIAAGVGLQRGDMLRIVGTEPVVEGAVARIGVQVAPSTSIDFIVIGLGIFLGGLVGVLATFSVGSVQISLSTSVGTLLAGLLVGNARTRHPLFARIPDGAVSLMTSLGLAAFVGLTGIHAGPIFFAALREAGVGLLFGGMLVTMLPQIIGLLFGHYVLRMNPILLLGGLSGSQTVTAAMAALQERAGSPVPVLGYTPAYPVANVLLTTWGTIIVVVIGS